MLYVRVRLGQTQCIQLRFENDPLRGTEMKTPNPKSKYEAPTFVRREPLNTIVAATVSGTPPPSIE
jgi:hypothetical protein